ncbi:Aste57867_15305 [Aphanomyces stellatus]|uniref:Aste57867_15305 protein n=1 Tax=Aphanomyces stellatus TaxID=120398 RepID=A0A485L2U9_9STRA|nr:hypothetical protein As57867_015249 [Aphanomyces stellatus]VFT92114.1 Aste57867_15305 [Aphanomyces stellatus]
MFDILNAPIVFTRICQLTKSYSQQTQMDNQDGGATTPRRLIISRRLHFGNDDPPKLNVNTATIEELQCIDGIGANLAVAIAAGRPFASLDELTTVRGIKAKTVVKLTRHLTVTALESP